MQKEAFKEWLSNKVKKKPAGDYVSRCKFVETSFQIDLDSEYSMNKGKELLSKMQYSIADERNHKEAPAELHFKESVNIRFRMANLRSAVNKYFEFCDEAET